MENLAICAIFKNESLYLYEWLSYHYSQGVRKFVLYDNSSTDDSRDIIKCWPHYNLVTVVDWPQKNIPQIAAYEDMVLRFRGVADWCAFIDCDEFLCPQSNLFVVDILRNLGDNVNGLYVHWWIFGSSGHVTRPGGLVTETFRWRAQDEFGSHYFGKSIMRLRAVTQVGLHVFRCQGLMVNDSGWEIDQLSIGEQTQKSHRLIALNHYFTKSLEEWRARRALGRADKNENDLDFYRMESEFLQHDMNIMSDNRATFLMQTARIMFYPSVLEVASPFFPAFLKTTHETLLCWDQVQLKARHWPLEQISTTIIVLYVEFVNTERTIVRFTIFNPLKEVISIDGMTNFTIVPGQNDLDFCLAANELFLCAEIDAGNVCVNRQEAGAWETFRAWPPESAVMSGKVGNLGDFYNKLP